jgi:hypothetical protein
MEKLLGFLFYLFLIGIPLYYLGERISLLIVKMLIPSLLTKLVLPSWSFLIYWGFLIIVAIPTVLLLDALGWWNIALGVPEWAPFYGEVRSDIISSLIAIFIIALIASTMTRLFFAWRHNFLQKRKRTKTN